VEAADLSFQLNGKVTEVLVSLGDDVKRGQPLASLDKTNAQLLMQCLWPRAGDAFAEFCVDDGLSISSVDAC